jgi:hypothetical protein
MRHRAALNVAAVTLPAAAAIGVASYLVARVEYLVLLAPATIGIAIGMLTARASRWQRLSRQRAAIAIATIGVLLAFSVHGALEYRRQAAEEQQFSDDYGLDEAPLSVRVFLEQRFGLDPDMQPGQLGSTLGPYGAIGLALIELILALGLAAWIARAQASEPACPKCGQWRVAISLGSIAYGRSDLLVERLRAGEASAVELLEAPDTRERTRLIRMACPDGHDGEGGLLRVVDEARDRRGRRRHRLVADVVINERDTAMICDALGSGE